MVESRSDPATPPTSAEIVASVSGAIAERMKDIPTAASMQESIDAALAKRDVAEEARAKAEKEKDDMKKKGEDDEEAMKKKADDRAELLVTLKPLLPEGTESRGKTNHELLVLAVGDEISDAAKRSEDYLTAKVEDIAKRREAGAKNGLPPKAGSKPVRPYGSRGYSVMRAAGAKADKRRI